MDRPKKQKPTKLKQFQQVNSATSTRSLRHPRKDRSSISSQARRKAKTLGGHCECFEKQAFHLSSQV
uniref:Uncharacterized protein n=1 Tax=Kalanchoe fedtschenkoi TaxID=63787 RepID=A0A7N0UN34_KALFE